MDLSKGTSAELYINKCRNVAVINLQSNYTIISLNFWKNMVYAKRLCPAPDCNEDILGETTIYISVYPNSKEIREEVLVSSNLENPIILGFKTLERLNVTLSFNNGKIKLNLLSEKYCSSCSIKGDMNRRVGGTYRNPNIPFLEKNQGYTLEDESHRNRNIPFHSGNQRSKHKDESYHNRNRPFHEENERSSLSFVEKTRSLSRKNPVMRTSTKRKTTYLSETSNTNRQSCSERQKPMGSSSKSMKKRSHVPESLNQNTLSARTDNTSLSSSEVSCKSRGSSSGKKTTADSSSSKRKGSYLTDTRGKKRCSSGCREVTYISSSKKRRHDTHNSPGKTRALSNRKSLTSADTDTYHRVESHIYSNTNLHLESLPCQGQSTIPSSGESQNAVPKTFAKTLSSLAERIYSSSSSLAQNFFQMENLQKSLSPNHEIASERCSKSLSPNHEIASERCSKSLSPNHEIASERCSKSLSPNHEIASERCSKSLSPNHEIASVWNQRRSTSTLKENAISSNIDPAECLVDH